MFVQARDNEYKHNNKRTENVLNTDTSVKMTPIKFLAADEMFNEHICNL